MNTEQTMKNAILNIQKSFEELHNIHQESPFNDLKERLRKIPESVTNMAGHYDDWTLNDKECVDVSCDALDRIEHLESALKRLGSEADFPVTIPTEQADDIVFYMDAQENARIEYALKALEGK